MVQASRSGNQLFGIRLIVARTVWVVTTALILFMLVVTVPIEYRARIADGVNIYAPYLAELNISTIFYATFRTVMDISLVAIFCAIGIVVFIRKPSSRIVIYTSIATQTFGALFVPTFYFLETARPEWSLPVSIIRALGLASGLVVYFYMIPDGLFKPAWTRWAALAWCGMVFVWLLFPNTPANLVHVTTWMQTMALSFIIYVVAFGSGIAAQLYRYRYLSDATQRQQTRWFVYGTTLGFTGFFLYYLPLVLWPDLFGQPSIYRVLHIFWGVPIYHLFILTIPVCISISITRYRLWEIDRLINRTLIAGALTIVLVLLYVASVVLLTQLFLWLTGSEQDNFVIAISTLAISSLFFPLRRRIQEWIDRRFYRQRYNTEKTLTALSVALREELDFDALIKGLITLVQNTLHPAKISVCLVEQTEIRGAGQLNEDQQFYIHAWIKPSDPLIAFFQSNPNILDISHLSLPSDALNNLKQTNVSIAVPLIGQGHFIGLINLGNRMSQDEYSIDDYHLLTILSNQAAPALRVAQMVRRQQAEIAERQRVEYEMNVASMIQKNFLPKQLPDLPNWQIAAHYQPARAVGGDFYDFHTFPDGRVALIIGDVSGHGVPAALLMVNVVSMLRDAARRHSNPGAILQHANNAIYPEMPPSMFITCLYAILDPACGEITFANAGHNLPLRWNNGQVEELWASGFPLGIMENVTFEEYRATIRPDEFILFFSDGIVEAHNAQREMFGEERIKEIIAGKTENARHMIDKMLQAVSIYIGDNSEQEDDVTIVSLHHNPADS